MKKKPPGTPHSVRIPENVDRVRAAFFVSPRRSARRHAVTLGMSRRSLHRILRNDLKFHPYKIMIVQQLKEGDFVQRREFCRLMDEIYTENGDATVFMTDEAHFHLNGYVNVQNCRYWASENPHELHQRPLHSLKVTVWCGISKMGIIGPYFFEEEGTAVTVTSVRYVEMLNNFLRPELERRQVDMREIWFQQDGATAHTARASMEVVRQMFPGHVISRYGDVHWPPRSPDLSICDFFLWGYLKSKVYINKLRTIDDLKNSIRQEIEAVPNEMLETAVRNFQERIQICINQEGRHLQDIIFRT
ncbi:unnamed protein product [Macrosiphum euphorbiae]|nr:unnamed protein product [Macrosiphum euphorbiae]CAI6358961.1 unnamed protein product [Macrosiphum euphorbiae]